MAGYGDAGIAIADHHEVIYWIAIQMSDGPLRRARQTEINARAGESQWNRRGEKEKRKGEETLIISSSHAPTGGEGVAGVLEIWVLFGVPTSEVGPSCKIS